MIEKRKKKNKQKNLNSRFLGVVLTKKMGLGIKTLFLAKETEK